MDRLNKLDFTKSRHEALDREHEVFGEIMKKIVQAYSENRETNIKDGLLRELHKYVDFHFTSEENLMLLSNDPNYNKHREEHQRLMEMLSSIVNVFDVEQLDLDDLIDFISIKLINHTENSDYELGQHLLKRGNDLV